MRILPATHQTFHHGDSFRGDTLQEWDGGTLPLFNCLISMHMYFMYENVFLLPL